MQNYYGSESYPKKPLPPFLRLLIFLFVPILCVLFYQYFFNPHASNGTVAAVLLIGVGLAFIVRSFATQPEQFIVALQERIRWVWMNLLAVSYTIINVIRSIVAMITRIGFWGIALLLYWISPVDLIPDVFFPVGFIDDGIFTVGFFTMFNLVLGMELKRKAQEAREAGEIETPFP